WRAFSRTREYVEVRKSWLDHDKVRALFDIEVYFQHRLAIIRRILLVSAAVTFQRRTDCFAERTKEGRSILGGIGHDCNIFKACSVEAFTDSAYLAFHQARRAHAMCTRSRLLVGHSDVQLECCIVIDAALTIEHAAVAVVGELIPAGISHDQNVISEFLAHPGQSTV